MLSEDGKKEWSVFCLQVHHQVEGLADAVVGFGDSQRLFDEVDRVSYEGGFEAAQRPYDDSSWGLFETA